jgi:spore germination protein YaaH
MLVAHRGQVRHDEGSSGRPALALVPQDETPPDVEVPVEAEFLVERPALDEVGPPERQAVTRDGVGIGTGSVLEMSKVRGSEAPGTSHSNRRVGQGPGERADHVTRRLHAGIEQHDDLSRRAPDAGIDRRSLPESVTRPDGLRAGRLQRLQLVVPIGRQTVGNHNDLRPGRRPRRQSPDCPRDVGGPIGGDRHDGRGGRCRLLQTRWNRAARPVANVPARRDVGRMSRRQIEVHAPIDDSPAGRFDLGAEGVGLLPVPGGPSLAPSMGEIQDLLGNVGPGHPQSIRGPSGTTGSGAGVGQNGPKAAKGGTLPGPVNVDAMRLRPAILAAVLTTAVVGCGEVAPQAPASSPSEPGGSALATGTSASGLPGSPAPTGFPATTDDGPGSPSPALSTPIVSLGAAAAATFGFAAKGMSNEVMAFVTSGELSHTSGMDLSAISTVAFFSVEASGTGSLVRTSGGKPASKWTAWTSRRMSDLIAAAHAVGTRVVLSVSRFAWSASQIEVARALLDSPAHRSQLIQELVAEVASRGIDGINLDFEPIPRGQRDNFTALVRGLRAALDVVRAPPDRPAYQLTYDSTGYYSSYDVAALGRPGAADAVYIMGYHYRGTWSRTAGSNAPMGGSRYDVVDTIAAFRKLVPASRIILGVPLYGHAWPTATGGLHARTIGGGHDVLYRDAVGVAAANGARTDPVEGVSWSVWRVGGTWWELYFDDAASTARKWEFVKSSGLLGTGIWAMGFQGQRQEHFALLRDAFLR